MGGIEERVRELERIGTEWCGKDFCKDSDNSVSRGRGTVIYLLNTCKDSNLRKIVIS